MEILKKIKKKLKKFQKNNFFKKSKRKKNNKIFIREKNNTFTAKRKKKFSNFRINFNLKDLSLKEYYEKYQKRNETNNYSYYFFVGIILIFLSIYAFFFSDYFNIKHIIINPKDEVSNVNMASKAVEEYRFKSIFFIPKDKIKEKLKNYQNNIKNIRIDRLFPNSLRIDIDSYESIFNVEIDNVNYLILKNGSFVPSKVDKNLPFLEIYYKDLSSKWILDYKKIFKNKYINLIKYAQITFLENILNTKIKKIQYYVLEKEVHLVLEKNTILIFSLNKNIKWQFENLLLFYLNYNKNFDNIYYMDLRIPKKVFYCELKDAYKCKKNLKKIYNYKEKIIKTNKISNKKNWKKIEIKKEIKKEKKKKFPKIKILD